MFMRVRVLVFMLCVRVLVFMLRTCACVHVSELVFTSRMINCVHAYVCLCSC